MQTTGTQNGSTTQQDAIDLGIVIKISPAIFHQAYPTVFVAHDSGTEFVGSGANNRADNSIQAGAIAAGGKYSKAHEFQLTRS